MGAWAKRSEWKPAASAVSCRSTDGTVVRGRPIRLTKLAVTFEFGAPECILRVSEVLSDLRIIIQDRPIYSGRGVIRSLVDTGTNIICEATLDQMGWKDLCPTVETVLRGGLHDEFKQFLAEWQKLYKVLPEYKTVIADMHTFLSDLRLWNEQVELALGSNAHKTPNERQNQIAEEIAKPVLPCIGALFEKFETVAAQVEPNLAPVHYTYIHRHLHPIVLCAPFAHRAFHKPLGYAGDYEIVNMMVGNRFEGSSLFAKVLNAWFLSQPPAEGHRNRLARFYNQIADEVTRVASCGRTARIFNLGCGPAWEIQQLIARDPLSNNAEFTLVDFNEETTQYVKDVLNELKNRFRRRTKFNVIRLSAQELLRHRRLLPEQKATPQFDYAYCGGLFDYLPDGVCERLLELLYGWVAPGGLLVITNVHPSNPLRHGMAHLLDWHLIYRTQHQLAALWRGLVARPQASLHTEQTGTNVFLELRKPNNA